MKHFTYEPWRAHIGIRCKTTNILFKGGKYLAITKKITNKLLLGFQSLKRLSLSTSMSARLPAKQGFINIFLNTSPPPPENSALWNKIFIYGKSEFLKKIYIPINFVWFLCITIFFCYPDPRFLKWIRIQPNEVNPGGSATLKEGQQIWTLGWKNIYLFLPVP